MASHWGAGLVLPRPPVTRVTSGYYMERPNISCYMEAALFRAVFGPVTRSFLFYRYSMYRTPSRPGAKRRLFTTPASTRPFKRSRTAFQNKFNRRYLPGVRTGGSITNQLKSLQRAVNALKPEIKYVDTQIPITNSVALTGSVIHLTQIQQGDRTSDRTGDAISVKRLAMRFRIDRGSFSTAGFGFGMRIVMFVDKQQIADTSPAIGDVLELPSGTGLVSAFPRTVNLERFRILYMSPYLDAFRVQNGDINDYYEFNWSGDLKVEFNGSAVSDIQKNGIYFGFVTNDTSNTVDGDGYVRVGFTDV